MSGVSFYSVPPLIGGIFSLFLGLFVVNKKSKISIIFFYFCFSLSMWLFAYAIAYSTKNELLAILCARIACTSVVWVGTILYHLVVNFLNLKENKLIIRFLYIFTLFLSGIFLKTNYFLDGVHEYYWGYYSKAGILHPIYLIFEFAILGGSYFLLLKAYFTKRNEFSYLKRNQIKYFLIAAIILLIAPLDYIPKYGFEFYPFGWIGVVLFIIIVAYSIVRYRLLDIRIALTRSAILIIVYVFIVGMPLLFAAVTRDSLRVFLHDKWFYPPLGLYTLLALLAPYIYLTFQNKAEQRRIRQQIRLHQSLKAASQTTIEVQSIDKLSKIIPRYLLRLYGKMGNTISQISLFLLNKDKKAYYLKSSVGKEKISSGTVIEAENHLVKWFTTIRDVLVDKEVLRAKEVEVLVYEDIDLWLSNPSVLKVPFKGLVKILKELKDIMKSLNANVILPSVYQKELLGFLILGEKLPDPYSLSDIDTFSILANDSAMAFKAAQLFEDLKTSQARLIQSEKLNLLGQLASSMAHEINNPLAIISGNIQLLLMDEDDPKKKEILKKINDQSERGYQIINRLLNFSRLSKEDIKDIEVNEIIDDTLELINHKILHGNIQLDKDYNCTEHINGNPTQIQEVLLNLFVNAVQAMPEGGRLKISTRDLKEKVEVVVQDTGKGIPDKDVDNVFDPFYTQGKENGTGLGLFVANQIMGLHNGSIEVKSNVGEGTTFVLRFSVGINEK